ncbi:MAG: excinuclease ABC subunit C [Candidatus Melainabacteria bacterium]|nr:MAG: excinuclease ABC subunit C [Candidatus Melainabacteria bacterium]
MNLLRDRFLFLDCQTTAANPVLGSILEIAWCDSSASEQQPGKIQCKLVSQPDKKEIPFRIQVITGISDEEMVNAVHEREIYFSLKKHCAENQINAAVVHYASFEKPFLHELFEKHGDEPFPLDLICTYQIARRLFPNLPTRGIRGLGGFFGASNCELKRSSHHVEMTFSIWQGLVAELAKQGIYSVEELRDWLKEPVKTKRTKYQYPLESEKRLSLPDKPGVYKMMNARGEILYVGKATSLKSRVNSYFRGQRNKDPRKLEMLTQTHNIDHIECGSALEAAILETDEIKRHDPPYNYSLKRKQRQLAFFDENLSSMSYIQSIDHPIGPFSGHFALEQFTRVHTWLTTGEDDPLIFFDEVPTDLISSGFELFCAEHNLDPTLLATPRDLMAFCIRFIRKSARLSQQSNGEATNPLDTGEPDDDDLEDEDSDDSLVEYTPEDVSGKFGRLFKRIAKSYLRGKVLTRLLNSRIIFQEKSKIRRLEVRSGEIVHSDDSLELKNAAKEQLWQNLDVMTYDRISVLLSEIIRMRAAGQNVIIEPDMPLSIVSHQII